MADGSGQAGAIEITDEMVGAALLELRGHIGDDVDHHAYDPESIARMVLEAGLSVERLQSR